MTTLTDYLLARERGGAAGDCRRVPRLAWIFIAYALPMIVLLSVIMAPFQVADEYNHTLRADQIANGRLIAKPIKDEVDGGLVAFGRLYSTINFHYEVKATAEMSRQVNTLTWGQPAVVENFQNTSQYGPLFYLPQSSGLLVGKWLGSGPVMSVLIARLFNGFVSIAIGFLTLVICRRGHALMFGTLLFPMTLSQFASVSQDALLIAMSLLVIAVASRVIDERRTATTGEFVLFCAVLVALVMARPPAVAFAVIGLAFVRWPEPLLWPKAVIAALTAAAIAAWMVKFSELLPPPPPGASAPAQFAAMRSDPSLIFRVMYKTAVEGGLSFYGSIVGLLGWMDTPLPRWYHKLSLGILACAWFAPGNRPPYALPAFLGIAGLIALIFTTAVGLYTSWAPVGHPTLMTAQGRYLLPMYPLLTWTAPTFGALASRWLSFAWIPVLLFPLMSFVLLPVVIVDRYYGSWSGMATALKLLYWP